MIKFFRKIRRNLLLKGQFGKYLKYATGEIILVVVGILIALQINNWNETSKENKKSISYLQQFKDDIENDVSRLEINRKWNEITLAHIDSIWISLSKKKLNHKDKIKFIEYHKRQILETFFVSEKSTYNLFLSSENDVQFKNRKLQKEIYSYYSFDIVTEKNVEKSLQIYQHQHISTSILENVLTSKESLQNLNIKNIGAKLNINELKLNKKYLTALRLKMRMTSGQNRHYKTKIDMANSLLNLLKKELD